MRWVKGAMVLAIFFHIGTLAVTAMHRPLEWWAIAVSGVMIAILGCAVGILMERYPRKPWSVILIGQESGQVSPPLSWVRFATREQAEAWCRSGNDETTVRHLAKFEPINLGGGS